MRTWEGITNKTVICVNGSIPKHHINPALRTNEYLGPYRIVYRPGQWAKVWFVLTFLLYHVNSSCDVLFFRAMKGLEHPTKVLLDLLHRCRGHCREIRALCSVVVALGQETRRRAKVVENCTSYTEFGNRFPLLVKNCAIIFHAVTECLHFRSVTT